MMIGASFQPMPGSLDNRTRLRWYGCLTLSLIFVLAQGHAAQQPAPSRTHAGPASSAPSPFLDAETLLRQGSVDEAKKRIQEQLALNPASVEGYNLLGIVYSEEKDYPNALEAFQHALRLDPNSTKTRNNLGNLYIAQQKIDLGEKEFRTVLRIDPANNDGNYNLGLVLMARGLPAEAIPHFQRVRPANPATRFNLIRAYFAAGRKAEGLKMASELSAQNKDDVQLHFTLGVLLASSKQYRAAQFELEKANSLQPETFEILYDLGQAYLRDGNHHKAEIVLKRAQTLKPD